MLVESLLPVEEASSGVEDVPRERFMELRGRFWPALGSVAVLGGAVVADLAAFFGGASGAGNSTSCVRSSRESGTHSLEAG